MFIWSERNFNKTNSFNSYFSSSVRGIPRATFCLPSRQPTTVISAVLLLAGSLLNQYIILPRAKSGKPDHMKQILLHGWWQIQTFSSCVFYSIFYTRVFHSKYHFTLISEAESQQLPSFTLRCTDNLSWCYSKCIFFICNLYIKIYIYNYIQYHFTQVHWTLFLPFDQNVNKQEKTFNSKENTHTSLCR